MGDVIGSPVEPVSTSSGSHPHAELDELKDTVCQEQSVVDRVVADTQGGGVKIPGGHRFDSKQKVQLMQDMLCHHTLGVTSMMYGIF